MIEFELERIFAEALSCAGENIYKVTAMPTKIKFPAVVIAIDKISDAKFNGAPVFIADVQVSVMSYWADDKNGNNQAETVSKAREVLMAENLCEVLNTKTSKLKIFGTVMGDSFTSADAETKQIVLQAQVFLSRL